MHPWPLLLLASPATAADPSPWVALEPGLEVATFVSPVPSTHGDSEIHVVRVDPKLWDLELRMASAEPDGGRLRTGPEWAKEAGAVMVINASMFETDYRTSVGMLRSKDHVNNPSLRGHKALFAFDPVEEGVAPVQIIDRGCEDYAELGPKYHSVVQGIRMIDCHGRNVWSENERKWSAAVFGVDGDGRALFVHARSPWTMHQLIDVLQGLPLGLAGLQYGEGGPEATLYVNAGGREHLWVGSYETGFNENDDNDRPWELPNVIVVRPRP